MMTETRELAYSMAALGRRLKAASQAGATIKSVADATGINRSALSTLANHGAANLTPTALAKLKAWLDEYAERMGSAEPAVSPEMLIGAEKKRELELFRTTDYTAAIGFCNQIIQSRKIGVVIGVPGTGKTTVAHTICKLVPKCIYIEAWKSMRLGDLLDEIGMGLGLALTGTTTRKTRELVATLKGSGYTLVVDEGENLKNHQVEKLDVLRKIHDNTGVALLLLGTPLLRNVLSRADVTQLSRRMYTYDLHGATAAEIRRELTAYDIDDDAAEALSRIAADTSHGGMGSYTMMMEFCLREAAGGTITMDMLRDARQYKIGLRE